MSELFDEAEKRAITEEVEKNQSTATKKTIEKREEEIREKLGRAEIKNSETLLNQLAKKIEPILDGLREKDIEVIVSNKQNFYKNSVWGPVPLGFEGEKKETHEIYDHETMRSFDREDIYYENTRSLVLNFQTHNNSKLTVSFVPIYWEKSTKKFLDFQNYLFDIQVDQNNKSIAPQPLHEQLPGHKGGYKISREFQGHTRVINVTQCANYLKELLIEFIKKNTLYN